MNDETEARIEKLEKEVAWLKEECARLKAAGQGLERFVKRGHNVEL